MEKKFYTYHYSQIKNFKILGRHAEAVTKGSPLAFFWTASGFAVNSKSGELFAELEADWNSNEPWVSVWVDGVQVSRFMVERGKHWVCLFRGLPYGSEHEISLLKETQAMSGDNEHMLLLHSVGFYSDEKEKPLDENIFLPVRERKHKIEFIGDSITTGEGLAGAVSENDWITAWMALNGNYALVTAAKTDSEIRILSQSGWGVFTSYDNDRNNILPKYYDKVCGLAFGQKNEVLGARMDYDFSKWQPDFVVVNLGTNDNGSFASPEKTDPVTGEIWKMHADENGNKNPEDLKLFTDAVYAFLKKIRSRNQNAHIIWCYGMVSFELGEEIAGTIEEYRKNEKDEKVHFLKVDSMAGETDEEKGSRGHPGRGTHKKAADALSCLISSL